MKRLKTTKKKGKGEYGMGWLAHSSTIQKVDNGFIIRLHLWDQQTTLIAKTTQEVVDLISGIEWKDPDSQPHEESGLQAAEGPSLSVGRISTRW